MRAKKSLGQNFLKSEPALRKIIETGEIKPDDVILEIGPGRGALTKKLLEHIYPHPASPYIGGGAKSGGGMVIAVEKDRELFEFLQEKFKEELAEKKLILLNEDILDFKINTTPSSRWTSGHSPFAGGEGTYKVIANIPYNITGAILKKFLTAENQPTLMVLMVQYEVAKRITTPSPSSTRRGGKESLLSISVKAYGEPKLIMKVPKRYFSPAPKVDSAVILIKNISRKNFTPPLPSPSQGRIDGVQQTLHNIQFEEKFWKIVKAGFAHKRKKLSGNLKNVISKKKLSALGLENKRAEDLALEDWISLTTQ